MAAEAVRAGDVRVDGLSTSDQIAAFMTRRFGRDYLLVPSGRLALFLALRRFLTPGDRILMSGVNDDVIFFVVLAAGLRPVIAPLSLQDGNIDVEAVPAETWSSVSAVLTTNLYGLPDRMPALRARCARHGLMLIEDCAHAILTDVEGAPVGTFGAAAALSLSKHVNAKIGGVLLLEQGRLMPEFERLRDALIVPRSARQRIGEQAGRTARHALDMTGLMGAARRARRSMVASERAGGYRMPLHPSRLGEAVASLDTDLDLFDAWVRVDRHDYRAELTAGHLDRIARHLDDLEAQRVRRVEGVRLLRELDAAAPAVRRGPAQPLFRVPLLVENRDEVRADLDRRGIPTHYIYDPPLDDYAGPAFAEPSPSPDAARWWASHVLPVDPLRAAEVLDALQAYKPGLRPATVVTSRPATGR